MGWRSGLSGALVAKERGGKAVRFPRRQHSRCSAPATKRHRGVCRRVFGPWHWLRKRKKLCIPFRQSGIRAQEALRATRYRGEPRTASLCRLRLLLNGGGAQGGAARLGGAREGAEGAGGVVAGAAGAAFEGGGGERPRLVIPAEGAGAEVTKGRGRGAALAAVVPWTFPASCGQTRAKLHETVHKKTTA